MTLLPMQNLRTRLEHFAVQTGLDVIPRSAVVNDVDPEQFNYSIEEPILRRYGAYLEFDAPWSFAVIQPFVRPTDFSLLVRREALRQSVFDVGAIRFALDPDTRNRRDLHRQCLADTIRFLVEEIGLDRDRLSFTCYGGGSLVEAARASGRELHLADPSLSFPPDMMTVEALVELGISEDRIFPETSLDTFLAEFPAPIEFWAGYRYEVFYTHPVTEENIEIGTGERLEYRRLVWEPKRTPDPASATRDIIPHSGCFAACGVGLDRLAIVTNKLATPYECDHIKPVYESALSRASRLDDQAARVLTDALRVLHLVAADGFGFDDLPSRHLKGQYRRYCRELVRAASLLGLEDTVLLEICQTNAKAQPWYGELSAASPKVVGELTAYRSRVASTIGDRGPEQ